MTVNALNDGTKSGTLANLANFLRFLASASENPELCDPGLHQAILQASLTAGQLEKVGMSAQKETNQAEQIIEN
ncbi:hypothetical protein ACOCGL_003427 [Vibrio cholerae]